MSYNQNLSWLLKYHNAVSAARVRTRDVILLDHATKNDIFFTVGGSCNFQPSFRDGSPSFVPNGRAGSCVF